MRDYHPVFRPAPLRRPHRLSRAHVHHRQPGSLHFQRSRGKVRSIADNGLIQIPSKIENKKYNLALDLGIDHQFSVGKFFDTLTTAHSDWPHMTGAVGPANMWGPDEEPKWQIMRLDRVQFGPLFLTVVPVVSLPKGTLDFFEKRAAMPSAGLIGANFFRTIALDSTMPTRPSTSISAASSLSRTSTSSDCSFAPKMTAATHFSESQIWTGSLPSQPDPTAFSWRHSRCDQQHSGARINHGTSLVAPGRNSGSGTQADDRARGKAIRGRGHRATLLGRIHRRG